MVTVPVSPYCELARWTLDRLSVAFTEECHAPFLHRLATRRHRGGSVVPVLNLGASSLTDARQIVDYYEERAPEALRLFPADPAARAECRQLFDAFFDEIGVAVRAWAYAYQLPLRRSTAKAWVDGAPALERVIVPLAYPLLAAIVKRSLKLGPDTIARERRAIGAAFERVETRLADGRRYLMGDRLSATDLALATLVAPTVLPAEYRGPLPTIDELPAAMRADVEGFRARPAGEFVLRLFREDRGPRLA